jgi:effector-binding domain-containing protein
MDYQVDVRRADAQITAVVRCRASQPRLPQVVPQLCGDVWKFIQASGSLHGGRHLALYLDCAINLEVGAEVDQAFVGDGRVVCSQTPAGLVATTAHFGPYNRLGDAHAAIVKWCSDHGHALAGPNWEVYGHWIDDPAQLRTDVFYLLQAAEQ